MPQLIVPLQPSETVPQLSPAGHAVAGVQTLVKVMVTGTVTVPAAPALNVSCWVRVPAVACAATLTLTLVLAHMARLPEAADSVTAGSSAVPVQVSACPPPFESASVWAVGAAPTCAVNDSDSGATTSCAGTVAEQGGWPH
jgi:hypothetical protein